MEKWIKKIIDSYIVPVILIGVLLYKKFMPLLLISRYNHSNADDFWMSSAAHHVWADTHSLIATIQRGFLNAVNIWKYWDGCFLSMFIGGLPPVVFHEDYYKYTFVVIAGMLLVGVIAVLFELLVRLFKFPIQHYLLITAAMIIMLFNFMPSIKDGYYWWVGGINYTFFTGVFLLAQALLIEYIVSSRKVFLILGSIVAFSVGLGNLLSGLINPLVLVLEFIVLILLYKKEKILFAIPVACGILGLMGNVLAPGNLIRGGEDLFENPVFASIFGAIKASIGFIPHFYRKPMFWFFLFMIIVIIDAFCRKKTEIKFRMPLLFVIISFGVYCAVFAPVVYAGSAYYGRCQNVSYIVMMFMYLLDIIYIIGWTFNKFDIKINKVVRTCAVYGAIAVLLFTSHYLDMYFDSAYAVESMRVGQAQDFDRRVDERFAMYYDDSIKEVYVEKIDWMPGIFYWDDDCLKDLEWYFQKDFIKVIE